MIDKDEIREKLQRDERSRKARAGYPIVGLEPCPRRRCPGYLSERVDGWSTCSECLLKDWRPDSKVLEYMAGREW